MKFSDIPKFTKLGNYQINMSWDFLEETIARYEKNYSLELNPDFQRGHIWTEKQQISYVEYKIADGPGADLILFNCVGWMNRYQGPFVLVDGLQRLTAVRKFLSNNLKIYDKYYLKDFKDRMPYSYEFLFNVNNLKTRKEVLIWYLQLNSAGTPHSKEEIDKVRELIEKEV